MPGELEGLGEAETKKGPRQALRRDLLCCVWAMGCAQGWRRNSQGLEELRIQKAET